MIRGFWFVAGAGAGIYASLRARRLAEAVTPDGLRDRAAGLRRGAMLFGEEVRAGMVERETELRDRLAVPGPRALPRGVGAGEAHRPTELTSTELTTTELTERDLT
ncbi:MAG: DUF6167 family protein [Marmoricola sp.]